MMSICLRSAICYVYSRNYTFWRYQIFCWARISQFLHCSQAAVTYYWKCFICWMNTSLFLSRYSKIRFFSFSLFRSNSSRIQYYCLDASATDLLMILSERVQSQFLRKVIVIKVLQAYKAQSHLVDSLICLIQQQIQGMRPAKTAKKERFAQQFSQSQANQSQAQQNTDEQASTGKPIQLIKIKPNGKIQIIPQAMDIIACCEEPVGFVCLVGKMRTGKSCLLNKILGVPNGFKVDPSTSSCTQGIWMWSQPYYNKQHNNYMFFLDTEGTDSLEKNAQNDQKIFTLSLLISTYFIYNSVGSINEAALSELQMVTALSKYISVGDAAYMSGDNEQIHKYMPKFLWLLRDFMLQIQDQRKKKISPSQYLQNCLNDKSAKSSQSNKIKKSIITYFPNRQCLTLVQPVDDEDDLQRLNQLPDHSLRREFIEGINILKGKIMSSTGPKIYQGKPITGGNFSVMLDSYVNAFNEGRVPNIKTAWEQIAQDQGAFAYNKALQRFDQVFNQQLGDNQPKGQEIHRIVAHISDQTKKQYEKNTYNNKHQQFEKKLKEFLRERQALIVEQNNKLNEQRNTQILVKHSQKIKSRIESNYYMANKSNMEQLESDIKEVTNKYNKQAKGASKGDLIAQFLATLTPMITSMKADNTDAEQKMRQAQRELNQQRNKTKQLQYQMESKEQQLKANQNVIQLNKKKPVRNSKSDKADRDQGCCSGGKCQIM